MKKAISWMAENHVTANLVMLLVVFTGLISLKFINSEVFPQIAFNMISVQVPYPGASPEDIEKSICLKVEEAMAGVDGIDKITCTASENMALATARLAFGQDVYSVKNKIQSAIDRITTFPEGAEKPIVSDVERQSAVIQLGLYGNMDEKTTKGIAEQIKDDLFNLYGISHVTIVGTRNHEISINVNENSLRKYHMSFNEIILAIKKGSLDLPGGKIERKSGDILLRTNALGKTKKDYDNIIVRANKKGIVRLKDVATVKDDFEESDLRTFFDTKPAALLLVKRAENESAITIQKQVKEYLKNSKSLWPKGVKIVPWRDMTKVLKARLTMLIDNAIFGFILVFIVLALFLDLRLAFWVSSGIFISFNGAFIVMNLTGTTINLISLFGFIVVLGIVVDDAIVVGESIFSFREKGLPVLEASKKGALFVSTPVVFSVLTTVAAFVPLFFIEGNMGQIASQISIVVVPILSFSLLESLFILPAHLSTVKRQRNWAFLDYSRKLVMFVQKYLQKFINGPFIKTYKTVVDNRYVSLSLFIAILMISFGLVKSGVVNYIFFPKVEGDDVISFLQMPKDVSVERTEKILRHIESAGYKTRDEFAKKYPKAKGKIIKHIFTIIGSQPAKQHGPGAKGTSTVDSSKAEVEIEIMSSETRPFTATEFLNRWRENVGEIPEAESLTFQSNLMSAGSDIAYEFSASSFKDLQKAVKQFKKILKKYPAVYNIQDDFEAGKKEIQILLKPSAATYGIRLFDLASQVRQAFYGGEALRMQRNRDEVKVMVRYPKKERVSLQDLEDLMIRTPKGVSIPFSQVAKVKFSRNYSQINRVNRKRVITVTAEVDSSKGNADAINKQLKNIIKTQIATKYRGFTYKVAGAQEEMGKTIPSMISGYIIALFIIYMLLAIPFKSYSQPFIVMTAIPFGFVGAVWAHFLLGWTMTIMSMVGLVALSGIVVNDSLVLVDYANQQVREGKTAYEGFLIAVKNRFRPIMLTTLTTFFGLMPMIFEKSIQAKIIIPMAITLGFGVLFATTITLFLIPSLGLILEDFKARKSGGNK